MKNETIYVECSICGNECEYDKKALKGSTWNINGIKIILCCPCEDDLLKKIAKGRGMNIKYGDGGEIDSVKMAAGIQVINKVNIFEEICKLETTAKCNYVDDMRNFTQEVLPYLKATNRELYIQLIKLYEQYYTERFW